MNVYIGGSTHGYSRRGSCCFFLLLGLQGSEETRLKPQHISTLVVSLAEFVRMADRKIIAGTLSQLKLELDFDSTAISQLQVVLFGFQDAVSIKHHLEHGQIDDQTDIWIDGWIDSQLRSVQLSLSQYCGGWSS